MGSPLFDKVTIELSPQYWKGKRFVIETKQNSDENIYVEEIKLNGKKLSTPFVSFCGCGEGREAGIANGGEANGQLQVNRQ